MLRPEAIVADLGLTMLLGLAGAVGAWLLRRRTSLSARNLYPPAAVGVIVVVGAIGLRAWSVGIVVLPVVAPWGGWRDRGRAMAVGRSRRWGGASHP
jgi:site-specific recombinase